MNRNFIDDFVNYAHDGFAPKKFYEWSAISAIAGALERKVWLPWDTRFSYYPNLYVLLVANPGIGKSTAMQAAVDIMHDAFRKSGKVKFIPTKVTEAKFLTVMSTTTQHFAHGSLMIPHSSGYYYASEASNSLQNLFGDFIAGLTDLYDCPKLWQKGTEGKGVIAIENACVNLLGGSTFQYLNKLVNRESIMGGFASRMIYVIQKENIERSASFQNRAISQDEDSKIRAGLVDHISEINQLTGPFYASEDVAGLFEDWFIKNEKERMALESESMQSLLVRKQTNLLKLSMIMSAAESSDKTIRARHWQRA